MRLASTTSNGPDPVGRLPSRARMRRTRWFRRAFATVASTAIGSVSTPSAAVRAEPHRGDRQDAAAAPDVEDARAGQRAAIRQRLDRREAQPRRGMQAGPERHPRVEREDHVVRPGPVAPPRRPDDDPPADPEDREERFPGIGPIRLVDDARPDLADGPQAERLEVTERHRGLGGPPFRCSRIPRREVGADRRGPGGIRLVPPTLRRRARTPARRPRRRARPARGSR